MSWRSVKLAFILVSGLSTLFIGGCQTSHTGQRDTVVFPYAGRQRFLHPPSDNGFVYYLSAANALSERFGASTPIREMKPEFVHYNTVDILEEMRKGIDKECRPFDESEQRIDPGDLLGLARALCYSQQTLADEGRPLEAVRAFLDGMKYGQSLQKVDLEYAWAGTLCQIIAIQPMSSRIGKLSPEALEELQLGMKQLITQTNPFEQMWKNQLQNEKRKLDTLLKEEYDLPSISPDRVKLEKQALDKLSKVLLENAKRPFYLQTSVMLTTDELAPMNGKGMMSSDMWLRAAEIQLLSAASDTRARLAYVQASVWLYKAKNNRFPASLEELGLGDLAIDPFSGAVLVYKPSQNDFKLYSVGPNQIDDGGELMSIPPRRNSWQSGLNPMAKGDLFLEDRPNPRRR